MRGFLVFSGGVALVVLMLMAIAHEPPCNRWEKYWSVIMAGDIAIPTQFSYCAEFK